MHFSYKTAFRILAFAFLSLTLLGMSGSALAQEGDPTRASSDAESPDPESVEPEVVRTSVEAPMGWSPTEAFSRSSKTGGDGLRKQQEEVGNQGTEFWLLFQRNFDEDYSTSQDDGIFIDVSSDVTTSGTVEIPGIGFSQQFTVEPDSVTRIQLPDPTIDSVSASVTIDGAPVQKGVHVTSADPVTVRGLDRIAFTTDGYLGLPRSILSTNYVVPSYISLGSGDRLQSQVAVVSPRNDNTVSITPSAATKGGRSAGETFDVTLDRGEVYQIRAAASDGDLTGTVIQSSLPVSAFSGSACSNVPVDFSACDHLIEQIPPTETWGSKFVTTPLEGREAGDTFRILAGQSGTDVTIDGDTVATLGFGDYYETILDSSAVIETTNPALVMQYMNGVNYYNVDTGDPFMMMVPPADQFTSQYSFATAGGGFPNNYISLTPPKGATSTIELDGTLLPDSFFEPIPGSDFAAGSDTIGVGTHNSRSTTEARYGLYSYGDADADSYGFTGGLLLDFISQSGAPSISRTQQTIDLSDQAQPSDQPLSISAVITDDESPFVQNATVYYRTEGESSYSTVSMSNTDSTWSADIPADSISDPGLEYYIAASDGELRTTSPSTNPQGNPYGIAVLPNEPPSITHSPVQSASPGEDIVVTAQVVDTTREVSSVELNYRTLGGNPAYNSVVMTNTNGDTYEGTIPGSDVTTDGVGYYIGATDDFGVTTTAGAPDDPFEIDVSLQGCNLAWSLEVTATDTSDAGSTLTLGQSGQATGGLDSDCGEEELPPVPPEPETDVRFVDGGVSGVDLGTGSLVDIRPADKPTPDPLAKSRFAAAAIWSISLQSDDYPFTVNWDQSAVVDSLPGETVRLVDAATGGDVVSVNMKEAGNATISNTSVETLEIQVGQLTSFDMTLADGWNFKSLPVQPENASFGAVMDPCRSAFGYEAGSGYTSIEVEDSLQTGEGYWFNCSAGTVEINGISASLDVDVDRGWNIVGPFTDSIDVSSITATSGEITSEFYGFDPMSGYSAAGSLAPTQAYWVKVSQAGMLKLYGGRGKSQPLANDEAPGTRLQVKGASGSQATLYLARDLSEEARSQYELPPKPPSGITDVRFEGDQKVASFDGTAEDPEFRALELQGVKAPVELRLDGSKNSVVKVRWGSDQEGTLTSDSPSMTVQKTNGLEVSFQQAPVEHFLEKSYPNPVTDRATIQYGLPEATDVRIELYDVLGRHVATLVNGRKGPGTHRVKLEADRLSSGTYFYRMSAGSFEKTRSVTITR